MKRGARLGIALLGVGLILAAISPLRERFFGRRRLRFPYLGRPLDAAIYAKLAAQPGWAKAGLEVAPGITLRGLLRRPSLATAPWVLFYPGNDASQLERGQAFLNRLAHDTDWGLAVFAYRGYDASSGTSELASMRADAPRLLAGLCATERVPPARVHLIGFSIGGHFAVHAAGGANRTGARAATLTLLAAVDDIVMYKPGPWETLSLGEDYQTRPFLVDVPAPVLVLQGTADEALAGPGQGRDLAKALAERGTYRELNGVKHLTLLEDQTALDTIRAFVRAHSEP